jgi:hypothetical protein
LQAERTHWILMLACFSTGSHLAASARM